MKAKRFTEEQIVAVLKEAEAGAKTKDLWLRGRRASSHLHAPESLREDPRSL